MTPKIAHLHCTEHSAGASVVAIARLFAMTQGITPLGPIHAKNLTKHVKGLNPPQEIELRI